MNVAFTTMLSQLKFEVHNWCLSLCMSVSMLPHELVAQFMDQKGATYPGVLKVANDCQVPTNWRK